MFRRVAVIAVAVAAALLIAVIGLVRMGNLTVTVGSGPITLIQSSAVTKSAVGGATVSLATPSTAGTALVLVVESCDGDATGTPPAITTVTTGWTRLVSATQGTACVLEVWVYLNNPGGISLATYNVSILATNVYRATISEWAGVATASALDVSGTATATAGTTLVPTTTAVVSTAGDVALAAWGQRIGAGAAVNFTTPAGFTRLADNSSDAVTTHLDVEYQINPTANNLLGPTLTSDTVSTNAVGVIVCLKQRIATMDMTAYIQDPGPRIKLNTLDMPFMLGGRVQLEDGSGFLLLEDGSGYVLLDTYVPQLGDPIITTNPAWSGRVVSTSLTDLTEVVTNYRGATIAATNTAVAVAGTSPVDLSDTPVLNYLLLEDGSGGVLLEDGSGRLVLEGSTAGYRNLQVQTTQNQDGSVTVYGSLETFEGGFAAGQAFLLTSTNLGYSGQQFTITNVTTTFLYTTPVYLIEFGDPYLTLQTAGGGVLTRQGSQAAIQAGIAMPAGTLAYQQITAAQNAVPNLTDISGLAATVTVVSGRRIRVRGFVTYLKHTSALLALDLFEGATQLSQWITTAVDTNSYTATLDAILTPSTGTHTYKLVVGVSAGTADVTASSTLPNFIEVSDVGT